MVVPFRGGWGWCCLSSAGLRRTGLTPGNQPVSAKPDTATKRFFGVVFRRGRRLAPPSAIGRVGSLLGPDRGAMLGF